MPGFLKRFFSRSERLRFQWEKRIKNIDLSKCAVCIECNDPIVPGDFIGECCGGERLVHAGFHDTATEQNAFCETAGIGIGYWDGEKIIARQESIIAKSLRTGEIEMGNY